MHNDQKKKVIDDFFHRNRESLENPIIKSFLKNRENLQLVLTAILDPTKYNMDMVDSVFQLHCVRIKKIKYISNLIYFFSIDFDKRKKREYHRNLLILDKPFPNDITTSPKDLIIDEQKSDIAYGDSLLDHIENEQLVMALKKLSQKQLRILEMVYLENRSLKEVAEILQLSPQNTSNHHRKALKKIYEYYTEAEVDD
ncbi:MAG: sigma-70 family RNA polymerase sigma factor [Bacillota bacterium]